MPTPAGKQAVISYVTRKKSTLKLNLRPSVPFKTFSQINPEVPAILIDDQFTFQSIEGFGGAFTDAAAETFYKLSEAKQNEILAAYFSTDQGIGYNLGRTHINSCDFSSETYAYSDLAGDIELTHFNIGHDTRYRIPFIRKALQSMPSPMKLFVSPWSPPAWMKTNGNMLRGGKLRKEYYAVWADYFVKFIQAYEKAQIPIWGLTVQNEPMAVQTWESCIFSVEEERLFVRDYLGPALHKADLAHIKIMIWDHNRDWMVHRAKEIYSDPEAAKYIWGLGFHWYCGNHFENVRIVHETFRDKKLLFTEGCVLPFDPAKIDDWEWGEQYAKSIIMDLNNGSAGWCDWNLLLNEQGGPNHVSNYCFAPIIADTRRDRLHYMNSFYYIGHFSKFIRPGAKRIVCSTSSDDLLCTAFINDDGRITVTVLNVTENELDFIIYFRNRCAGLKSAPRSLMTMLI
jgi:glucosylceramidase